MANELGDIKRSFTKFINSMEHLMRNYMESINVLRTCGGPEIFEKLNTLTSAEKFLNDELNKLKIAQIFLLFILIILQFFILLK